MASYPDLKRADQLKKPLDAKHVANLRLVPEASNLPDGWGLCMDPETKEVGFWKGQLFTRKNPTLGPLPEGWILKSFRESGTNRRELRYEDLKNGKSYRSDPRQHPDAIKKHNSDLQKYFPSDKPGKKSSQQIAGTIRKFRKGDNLEDFERAEIETKDITHRYEYLHTIDGGVGGAGGQGIGGMNAGVYVVRMKGSNDLYVEKRICTKSKSLRNAFLQELWVMRKVKHSALTFWMSAFITPSSIPLTKASVYMEFCDRGSLSGIMKAYKRKRAESPPDDRPRMPEKFIWHCFIGLCDALAYLRTGLYFVKDKVQDPNEKRRGWVPILHRDIKPDNILLRSRATSGNRKYVYVTLSDFGLACEDYPAGDSKEASEQKKRLVCGTPTWLAPELCYSPYAKTEEQLNTFPGEHKFSEKTDIWALATTIFDLAECDEDAHFYRDRLRQLPSGGYALTAKFLHKEPKAIKLYYSKELRQFVLDGTNANPDKRPRPARVVLDLIKTCKMKYKSDEPDEEEKLPEWATRTHDYHTREPFPKPPWLNVDGH